MGFLKLLWFALKGLLRPPHIIRNLVTFASVVGVLLATALILAGRITENAVLAFCIRWSWIPLSVLYLVLRHGEPFTRRRFARFFWDIDFTGYDGTIPTYIKAVPVNRYLEKVSFQSTVHPDEWKKQKNSLEMFFGAKIHKFESKESIKKMDIFTINETLPNCIAWDDRFMVDGRRFAVGEGLQGSVIWDAVCMPHGIVAGASSTGKTNILRLFAHQAIQKKFNVQVFDFKGGGDFVDLEDGYGSFIISDPEKARGTLTALIVEVRGRMERFKNAGVTNIDEFNELGGEQLIPWLIILDEAAEILDVKPKNKDEKALYTEIDQSLRTLARISRAAGVHILFGIIRPSADVLDGQIKNNALWRSCGYFADPHASRLVLDSDKATELPPEVKGRFIIGDVEVQAYYLPPQTGMTT